MWTVIGGGAVGLTLAARLARAGAEVEIVTRREEAARALQDEGLRAEDPADGTHLVLPVRAVAGLEDAALGGASPLLCCTQRDDVPGLAAAFHARCPERSVVTFQNDVESEAALALHHAKGIGGVWRETCTRLDDRSVRFQLARRARAIVGRHPAGVDDEVRRLAAGLRHGGIDVGVSERIAEDKWLKLCVNLTSAPNALVRKADHTSQAFVDLKVRLLEEARSALRAAGIRARSCDGRDRSLDEEIAHHASSLARGTSARTIPLYNQIWATLHDGRPLEGDGYHRRIIALADAHGTDAKGNARVLAKLLEAQRERLGPECFEARALA